MIGQGAWRFPAVYWLRFRVVVAERPMDLARGDQVRAAIPLPALCR